MTHAWMAVIAAVSLSGCGGIKLPIHSASGPVQEVSTVKKELLKIGIVADSQIQTRSNYNSVLGYKGRFEDRRVHVSMRPPALDWAARSMLRSSLLKQKEGGANAIFFLGDGANNGCYDEFAEGFEKAQNIQRIVHANDQGLLALLDQFRAEHETPVYFILGNHDVLGAGSTESVKKRERFCADLREPVPGRPINHFLTKAEIIRLVNDFNKGNDRFNGQGWFYRSSYHERDTPAHCGDDPARQPFTAGCYLAAIVDYKPDEPQMRGGSIQFLLLDTNDWKDVWKPLGSLFRQLGLRGGMSFKNEGLIQSQTSWFTSLAKDPVAIRVALSHYDLEGLKAQLGIKLSNKTQRFMDLFVKSEASPEHPDLPWRYKQEAAFFISGHTHAEVFGVTSFPYRCTDRNCVAQAAITELNVGSTTDFSNYATLVTFNETEEGPRSLRYSRVNPEGKTCDDVYSRIKTFPFPREVAGVKTGWKAIGINSEAPESYTRFKFKDALAVWENMEKFAQSDHETNCIGLVAAGLEAHRISTDILE